MIKDKVIGRRYDGGKSPLGRPPQLRLPEEDVMLYDKKTGNYRGKGDAKNDLGRVDDSLLLVVPPPTRILDNSEPFNLAASEQWSDDVQANYEAILNGHSTTKHSKWVDAKLAEWGTSLEQASKLSKAKREKLCNKLVREAARIRDQKYNELLDRMLHGTPDPTVPGAINEPDANDVSHRGGFPKGGVDPFSLRVGPLSKSYPRDDAAREERTKLHMSLCAWANGPLVLEHPQGSSFHHLVEYDSRTSDGTYAKALEWRDPPQLFVVEMDWARTFAGFDLNDGEAPLPFPNCVFEFRISGVRVLAFYQEDTMFCVYGRDGIWVCDDYFYEAQSGKRTAITSDIIEGNGIEFPRVSKLVRDNVRVATIMIDAQVAEVGAPRVPGDGLVKQRVRQGKQPPRAYYVVDLKNRKRYERGPASGVPTGIKMRGHWRRGAWVHYGDPDSGEVQYVDSGGFWHSRTWRRWHLAGDLSDMIQKIYEL